MKSGNIFDWQLKSKTRWFFMTQFSAGDYQWYGKKYCSHIPFVVFLWFASQCQNNQPALFPMFNAFFILPPFPTITLFIKPTTPAIWFFAINRKLLGNNVEINRLMGLLHGKPIPAISIGILFLASAVITFPISSNSTSVGIDLTLNFSPRYCPRCPMASVGGNASQFIWVKYCPKASTVLHREIQTISNSSFLPRREFILL